MFQRKFRSYLSSLFVAVMITTALPRAAIATGESPQPSLPLVSDALTPPTSNSAENIEQRALFAEVVKMIETQRRIDPQLMREKLAQLRNYPLYPYALKYWLLARLDVRSRADVNAFLAQYDGQPVARNVRKRWLQTLMDAKRNQAFIEDYEPGLSAELDCFYLRKTLPNELDKEVLDSHVARLWMVAYSQPKACDPLFRRWKNAGLQTSDRSLKRMKLAVKEGNIRLAQYLARGLSQRQNYLAKLWQDAHRYPHRLSNMRRFPGRYEQQEAEAFVYAMNRWVWSNPERVISALERATRALSMTEEQYAVIVSGVALSLAVDQHPEAQQWLQRASDLKQDPEIVRWHVATSVRNKQWQQTLEIIDQASAPIAQDLSYTYWQGRSWQQLEAPEKAVQQFSQAAQQRHYYGFLASAQLDQAPNLNHREPVPQANIQQQLLNDSFIQRAYELFQQKRYAEARRVWWYALRESTADEKLQAALLAHEWRWFDQSIALFTQLGYLDDVYRRFPVADNIEIQPAASKFEVDPALAYAITRRESSFMVDAVSSAGARGLMQVLPSTAQYLTQTSVRYRTLLEPDKNVELGVQYLRYLLDKADNNTLLATASYNAGWNRVSKWIPRQQALPADVWIESIPYRETRNYVKAVLAYKYIYQLQLGRPSDVFEQLEHMLMSPQAQ